MMLLVNEPGTKRLFVNDMRGPLYAVSYDGKTVTPYVDINASNWGVNVQSQGRERGFQSFAFHPQFNQPGTRGYGKFYTYTDSSNMQPKPDFVPAGGMNTHDTVLFEWTAKNPAAATYDGGPPREIVRFRQPFANHNAGLERIQSAGGTGLAGLRPALLHACRRRQRRRSAEHGAEPRNAVRKTASDRPARQQQRERQVRNAGEQPVHGG
jgi:hypothetical protein